MKWWTKFTPDLKENYWLISDLWRCPDYVALTWIRFAYAVELSKNPMDLSWMCVWCILVLVVCCSHTLSYWVFFSLAFCQSRIRIYSVNTIGFCLNVSTQLSFNSSHTINFIEVKKGRKCEDQDTKQEKKDWKKEKKITTKDNKQIKIHIEYYI